MQVNSVPNKYEIYQDYYLVTNGKEISYTEALRLFSQMNNDERNDFEQYYKDETGYEIIDANGYYFGENAQYTESGTKKVKKHWKIQTGDGSFGGRATEATEKDVKIYTTNSKKAYIDMKYTIEGYAKEKGIILDPVWSQYSAEEIMRMKNNGVNIPKEIVNIASTILETTATNYESNGEEAEEAEDSTETTEKEPFLELIPKAEKKIEKCNENNDKINAEIESILPEKQKQERNLAEKMKDQRNSLEEYEKQIREWRTLQDKVNNGEALSDTEAKRYAEITGMLEDRKSDSEDFQIDKNEIAKSLNQINILALIGDKLAEETIEIGDTLADYTSKTNYKTTKKTATQEVGLLRSIIAMANGKTLAKEATKIGNDTKDYSDETTNSVNDIASLLGVENSITTTAPTEELQNSPEIKTTEETVDKTKTNAEAQENISATNEEQDQTKATEQTNDTQQEDFIITDDNVNALIEEADSINSDLAQQLISALNASKSAKSDKSFALIANKTISKIVKEYQEEEARRQDAIKTKEQENEKAKKELESLTGKSSEEIDEELNSRNSNNNSEENLDESTQNKIRTHKQTISDNNKEIATIQAESTKAVNEFKNDTRKEQTQLNKSIPEETQALENNSKYLQENIPQYKERLNFTANSGINLGKMGKYRVTVGVQQLMSFQIKKGLNNINKGSQSMTIGSNAEKTATKPTAKLSEKATTAAVAETNDALTSLNSINSKIVSVTGEDTATPATTPQSTNTNENQEQDNTNNTQTGAAANIDNTNNANNQTTNNNTTTQTAPAQNQTINANEDIKKEPANTSAKEINKSIGNSNSTVSEENPTNELNTASSTPSTTSSSEKNDDEMSTDDAQDNVDDVKSSAKDDGKESEQIKKDTDKTTKELEKETKQLTKLMKKDEKDIIKMTKESTEAAKKQEEALTEYETLVAENEQLIAEDENNQQTQAPAQIAPQQNANEEGQTTLLGNVAMSIGGEQQSSNADKIAANDQRINELGVTFNTNGRVIERNRTKITRIQKTTKTRQKKFNKKTDLIEQKNKENQQKELEKQKKLQKQLGAVGIAENVFQITLSTGQIMCMVVLPPWIPAAGAVMVTIGQYGVLSCGLTKGVINIANGNLTAGLMAIGQSAISLATSMTGTGAAAGGVLGAVSAGLSVVSSSAELVNNVRAVQGKEANGVFSKISTIAGVASSITSSAATLSNLGESTASTFGKSMQIAGVAGSALSSASQLMTEFGGESQAANILGMIGGAVSTVASLGMLADKKFNNASEQNKENKEKTNATENKSEQTNEEQQTEAKKAEAQAKTEEKQIEAEVKKAEQEQKTETTDNTNNENKMTKEEKKLAKEQQKRKENNIKNEGASEEYADIDTDQLQNEIFAATDAGDTERARALALESTRRNYYKAEIAPKLKAENRQNTLSNVINAVSGVTNVAGSLLSSNSEDQQQPKKKNAPAGKLTERTKEIMRKNKKRIAALASKGYNI
ncbi:unknown [Clostridium sp. CAG:768]|nr:unknown [Clostridium sp. CAG:768]